MKILLAAILLTFSLAATAGDGTEDAFIQYVQGVKNMSLAIEGRGNGSFRNIPGEAHPVMCFTDIPMYDRKSGMLVGYAEDCLANVAGNSTGGVNVLPGYTYLRFFAPGGETWDLVVSGNINVQPATALMATQYGVPVTHITGSSKKSSVAANGVVGFLSTGLFKNAKGQGRISGAVNMSNLDPDNVEGSTIDFSCYFNIVDLDLNDFSVLTTAQTL